MSTQYAALKNVWGYYKDKRIPPEETLKVVLDFYSETPSLWVPYDCRPLTAGIVNMYQNYYDAINMDGYTK